MYVRPARAATARRPCSDAQTNTDNLQILGTAPQIVHEDTLPRHGPGKSWPRIGQTLPCHWRPPWCKVPPKAIHVYQQAALQARATAGQRNTWPEKTAFGDSEIARLLHPSASLMCPCLYIAVAIYPADIEPCRRAVVPALWPRPKSCNAVESQNEPSPHTWHNEQNETALSLCARRTSSSPTRDLHETAVLASTARLRCAGQGHACAPASGLAARHSLQSSMLGSAPNHTK